MTTMPVWVMGLLGGLIGGGVMGLGMTFLAPYRNFGGFATPAKLVTVAVSGPNAVDEGGNAVALGAAIHLVLSMILGVIFALLMAAFNLIYLPFYTAAAVLLGSGLIYASLVFGVSEFLALPFLDRPMMRRLPFLDFGAMHMIWGGLLGWAILIFR